MNERPITEDDLQAFVDERLEPPRQRQVEAYLAEHPESAARLDAFASQRDALRAALAPVASEPIPNRLDIRHLKPRRSRWSDYLRPLQAVAAAAVLVVAGGLGGWQLNGHVRSPQNGIGALAQEAADSYSVFATDPQHPVEVAEPVVLSHWVGSRINRPVGVPDLARAGFRLLGGRVVSTPHGAAGLYMYEDAKGMRLGVLVRPMKIDRTAKMVEHDFGNLSGYSWADQGLGYSLVGTASPSTLHPVADEVRRQLGEGIS